MKRVGQHGFSIIELIITIVVLSILTLIAVVTYQDVKKAASANAMASDLSIAAVAMEHAALHNDGIFPNNIPEYIHTSENVVISLYAEGDVYYWGLSEPQKGKLVYLNCQDLLDEGYGQGLSEDGSSTVDYVTECNVYTRHHFQIKAWSTTNWNDDVTEENLTDWITEADDNSNPNVGLTAHRFMEELIDRYTAQGGAFPITSFWDPNGKGKNNVPEPNLPEPDTSMLGKAYCIEAAHEFYDDLHWKIESDTTSPQAGTCT